MSVDLVLSENNITKIFTHVIQNVTTKCFGSGWTRGQLDGLRDSLAPLEKLLRAEERVRFSRAHKTDCQFRGCTCGAAAEHNIAQGELTREWSAILEL